VQSVPISRCHIAGNLLTLVFHQKESQGKEEGRMNLKPLGDRLVVQPLEGEEQTSTGIYLPETAKEKPQQGEVVAAGPGARDDDGNRISMDVSVGDIVLYARYSGTNIKLDSNEVLIIKESDVLALVEK
jgi:chaperonin GroES